MHPAPGMHTYCVQADRHAPQGDHRTDTMSTSTSSIMCTTALYNRHNVEELTLIFVLSRPAIPTLCRRCNMSIYSRSAALLYRHYGDDATCPLRQPISSVKTPHSWYDCPLDSTTKSIQLPLGQYDAAKSVPLSIGQYCTNPSLYACPLDRTAQCKSVLSRSDEGSPPPFSFFSFFHTITWFSSFKDVMWFFTCQGFFPHLLSNLRGRM